MPDYSASKVKNDLGYLTFDLQTDILFILCILLNISCVYVCVY